jgi:hypothetical protein
MRKLPGLRSPLRSRQVRILLVRLPAPRTNLHPSGEQPQHAAFVDRHGGDCEAPAGTSRGSAVDLLPSLASIVHPSQSASLSVASSTSQQDRRSFARLHSNALGRPANVHPCQLDRGATGWNTTGIAKRPCSLPIRPAAGRMRLSHDTEPSRSARNNPGRPHGAVQV